jgi:hypothetical protein
MPAYYACVWYAGDGASQLRRLKTSKPNRPSSHAYTDLAFEHHAPKNVLSRHGKRFLPERTSEPSMIPDHAANHTRSADFVADVPESGRHYRTFSVNDGFRRE